MKILGASYTSICATLPPVEELLSVCQLLNVTVAPAASLADCNQAGRAARPRNCMKETFCSVGLPSAYSGPHTLLLFTPPWLCEAASRSESAETAPSALRQSYQTTC